MGSTPYPGTIQDLTFNLFSILADQRLSANALFWITVWITAMDHGPRAKIQAQGPWSTDLVPRIVDRVPKFKLRGSPLVDAEPGYLGRLLDLNQISSRGA